MPTYDIEDIKRLNVQPGDVLLVTMPRGSSMERAEQIRDTLETNLPVRVLFRTPGVEVEVIGQERTR
jgi:hypothetical protein